MEQYVLTNNELTVSVFAVAAAFDAEHWTTITSTMQSMMTRREMIARTSNMTPNAMPAPEVYSCSFSSCDRAAFLSLPLLLSGFPLYPPPPVLTAGVSPPLCMRTYLAIFLSVLELP